MLVVGHEGAFGWASQKSYANNTQVVETGKLPFAVARAADMHGTVSSGRVVTCSTDLCAYSADLSARLGASLVANANPCLDPVSY